VFTEANAGRDFDWRPRADPSATVASSRGLAKPAFDYFVKIAETPSPSSQNWITSAFFLRSSLVGIMNDKGRYRQHRAIANSPNS
jgi:hypothetical protein